MTPATKSIQSCWRFSPLLHPVSKGRRIGIRRNDIELVDQVGIDIRLKVLPEISGEGLDYVGGTGGAVGHLNESDNRGITAIDHYEALNRLQSNSDGTPAVTYSYDPAIANGKGRLARISNSNSITNFTSFDALGNVRASNQQTMGRRIRLRDDYDRNDALTLGALFTWVNNRARRDGVSRRSGCDSLPHTFP